MRTRLWIAVLSMVIAFAITTNAQQPTDTDAVKAVNDAFYAALSSKDIKAMEAVWSKTPSTVLIGPGGKTILVGWDAIQKYWVSVFEVYSQVSITCAVTQGQTDGTMAWIVGTESGQVQFKSGSGPVKFNAFVTHIFQKAGDRWLLVSHQSQLLPK